MCYWAVSTLISLFSFWLLSFLSQGITISTALNEPEMFSLLIISQTFTLMVDFVAPK